jgi:hypothetical protein
MNHGADVKSYDVEKRKKNRQGGSLRSLYKRPLAILILFPPRPPFANMRLPTRRHMKQQRPFLKNNQPSLAHGTNNHWQRLHSPFGCSLWPSWLDGTKTPISTPFTMFHSEASIAANIKGSTLIAKPIFDCFSR